MCAWWTGQPIYGSNPTSKYVRENFAYLKTLVDQHEATLLPLTGSGIDIFHLAYLINQYNEWVNPATNEIGQVLVSQGAGVAATWDDIPIKSSILRMETVTAASANLSLISQYNGDAVGAVLVTNGYNGANFQIPDTAHIIIKDAAFAGTIRGVIAVIPTCYPVSELDIRTSIAGGNLTLHWGDNSSTPNLFTVLDVSTYGVIELTLVYIAR